MCKINTALFFHASHCGSAHNKFLEEKFEQYYIEDLAKHFFISKSHLSRIFREVTGFSANEYRMLQNESKGLSGNR
jgi:AraC-like DNA-binding protein